MDFILSVEPDFNKNEYELELQVYDESRGKTYEYNYVKYINGIRTADAISITVRDYGHVLVYTSFSIGLFDKVSVSENVVMQAAEKAVYQLGADRKKAQASGLTNVPKSYNISKDYEMRLVKLKDGTYALEVPIDIEYEPIKINGGMYPLGSGETYFLRLE